MSSKHKPYKVNGKNTISLNNVYFFIILIKSLKTVKNKQFDISVKHTHTHLYTHIITLSRFLARRVRPEVVQFNTEI